MFSSRTSKIFDLLQKKEKEIVNEAKISAKPDNVTIKKDSKSQIKNAVLNIDHMKVPESSNTSVKMSDTFLRQIPCTSKAMTMIDETQLEKSGIVNSCQELVRDEQQTSTEAFSENHICFVKNPVENEKVLLINESSDMTKTPDSNAQQEKDVTDIRHLRCTSAKILIEKLPDAEANEKMVQAHVIEKQKYKVSKNIEYACEQDHFQETRVCGFESEDDDDSIRDPNYEALSSSESCSSDTEPILLEQVDHVVADTEVPINNNSEIKVYAGRPKKGRKRKYHNQNRSEKKKKKNSNDTYYNYKGKEIKPKEFIDYDCKCKLKCSEHVPAEIRKSEFERFWSLGSYDSQVNFIAAGVQQFPKKRLYGRNPERRKFSRCYKIQDKVVCREMYIRTFKITSFRVNTALKKFKGDIPLTDQRGVTQGGQNKLAESKIQEVVDQIKKIPKYKSHYRREQTGAEFLPPELTMQKMYEMYCQETENPVSISSYKKIFYQRFNLKFKTLKKDTCNTCDRLKVQVDNEINPEKKETLQNEYNKHLQEAENAQRLRRLDFQLAKENENYECLTFDLEKTLPLPRIPTNIVFYKRQLWVYNCGIHNGKEDQGYCYVWAEGVAGRGAQEVGSCLLKHINAKVAKSVRHLILWSDSCGGQNRNIKLTLMLKAILHESSTLIDITLKFLCSGHSFLPNDSDFAQIESALKKQQRLYLPSEYVEVMRQCRKKKPFMVTEMNFSDFLSVHMIEKNIVNRKTSVDGQKINWLKIRSIFLQKHEPFLFSVQQDSFEAAAQTINVKRKEGRNSTQITVEDIFLMSKLWPNGKPIATKKLANLNEMMHLIPSDCQDFYKKLQGDDNIEEDIDGYNIATLDFEVEHV